VFDGALVLVAVRVGDGRAVSVTVGVSLGSVFDNVVEVGVGVGGAVVFVAVAGTGGAVTVKDPDDRDRETEFPLWSVAVALPSDKLVVPEEAPALTPNETLATVPLDIAVWFRPNMITLILPEEGEDQESVLEADDAAPPMATFCTLSRLASNERSKFNPVTPTPSSELN
jgi:hypothetical protein